MTISCLSLAFSTMARTISRLRTESRSFLAVLIAVLPFLTAGAQDTHNAPAAAQAVQGDAKPPDHSARNASTAFTLAARAAGTAEAMIAAARITMAAATKMGAPG